MEGSHLKTIVESRISIQRSRPNTFPSLLLRKLITNCDILIGMFHLYQVKSDSSHIEK
jgi:hypothetical protein